MFEVLLKTGATWIVCGGRDFSDADMFKAAMRDMLSLRGIPARVVHGGANGADKMARDWAMEQIGSASCCPANWDVHGKAAGPIRNQAMVDDYGASLVVAFPGGRGTADLVRRARAAGIDVAEIVPNDPQEKPPGRACRKAE